MLDFKRCVDDAYYIAKRHGKDKYIVLAACSIGSMNYGLETDESDCDVFCVVIPLWKCGDMDTEKLQYQFGEITIVDIRSFINNNLKKQCHTSLEPLFSKYVYSIADDSSLSFSISTTFCMPWIALRGAKEKISHYDARRFIDSNVGYVTSMFWKFKRSLNSDCYDCKAASHFFRGMLFIENFFLTGSAERSYTVKGKALDFLLNLKKENREEVQYSIKFVTVQDAFIENYQKKWKEIKSKFGEIEYEKDPSFNEFKNLLLMQCEHVLSSPYLDDYFKSIKE